MRKMSIVAMMMVAMLGISNVAFADSVEKPYLSLGADLNKQEKSTVLRLLEIDKKDLNNYQVVSITNADEHKYLDDYLSSSVIGTRALSSVLIEKKDKGHGITVTTKNITYCTEGMYQNALTTAGISDADVVVAGPFNITGTAALVGAMKAYEDMTGESINEDSKDAATNELVVTGALANEIGDSKKAEEYIAIIKKYVIEKDLSNEKDIEQVIDEASKELDVSVTDEQKQELVDLMKKIDKLNLNVDDLKSQAKQIYDKLGDIELNQKGFFDIVKSFLQKILDIFS